MHREWKLITHCSFAAVVGRKIFWVLWLHSKSCHFYIYVTLFSLELTLIKTYLVSFVLNLSSRLWLILFAFFLTQCMWPNQLPHFSSQSPQVQLWKWPFSHLRGTDAELRVCTFVDSRFKLPRTVFVTLPQNMEEQLERGIDLNRTKVRIPCSCWRWGC